MKLSIRKVLILLGLLAVVVVTAGQQTDTTDPASCIEVPIPKLGPAELETLPNGEVLVNVGEFPQGGNPGDPMLPYNLVRLLVPPDANLATAKAELVSGNWEFLPGEHDVAPAPPAASWDSGKTLLTWCTKDMSVIINRRDSTIYSKDAYFPSQPVQLVSVGLFRQWKLVEFKVWLAAYNPVKKKVRVLRNAIAALSTEALPTALATGLNSPSPPVLPGVDKFVAKLSDMVANPQDLETFYGGIEGASSSTWDYVIITTNTIVTNSNKLDDFISAKEARGYTVKVVTEQETADDTHYVQGSTLAERANNIRSWLQGHYVSDGIEYVLLIGNPTPEPEDSAPTSTSLPMKMCWPRSGAEWYSDFREAPSDMFFAELSNTWNWDGDDLYGEFYFAPLDGDYREGGADKYCEVYLGRIPVYNQNYTDLDSILQKTIDYGNAGGNLAWRRKILIPAAILHFSPQDNNGDGDAVDDGDPPDIPPDIDWSFAINPDTLIMLIIRAILKQLNNSDVSALTPSRPLNRKLSTFKLRFIWPNGSSAFCLRSS